MSCVATAPPTSNAFPITWHRLERTLGREDAAYLTSPRSVQAAPEQCFEAHGPEVAPTAINFLSLPGEIRNKIYRLLLCDFNTGLVGVLDPAGCEDSSHKDETYSCGEWMGLTGRRCKLKKSQLHLAILSTNRQIYSEGIKILYGENVFSIRLWQAKSRLRIHFLDNGGHFERGLRKGSREDHRPALIRNYEITVAASYGRSCPPLREALAHVYYLLRLENMQLHQLNLVLDTSNLQPPWDIEKPEFVFRILEPPYDVPIVARANVNGVPPRYAKYLKDVMEAKYPVPGLPRMYRALQEATGSNRECQADLERACQAMADDDMERFKRIRTSIIAYIQQKMIHNIEDIHFFDVEEEP
ncbi:MAG: hypothetical protein M1837_003733 [Sclerophora amabilis]|nr:MAG: hypothetical protein M1837_003733 [Sclerophora amabilis]